MTRILTMLLTLALFPSAVWAEPTKVGLCKGAIATIMYKDPGIMQGNMKGEEAFINYSRPADGSRFEMKCKFPKNGVVIWAGKTDGEWGRWREKTSDSIVTYSTGGSTTKFKENMGGAVIGSKEFPNTVLQ